jgi:hypothetical protein
MLYICYSDLRLSVELVVLAEEPVAELTPAVAREVVLDARVRGESLLKHEQRLVLAALLEGGHEPREGEPQPRQRLRISVSSQLMYCGEDQSTHMEERKVRRRQGCADEEARVRGV